MRLGAHLRTRDPLAAADRLKADVRQLHLSSPRTWRHPAPRDDAADVRRSARVVAVHAPYLCNPASADPTVRERTTLLLQATLDAAAAVGAARRFRGPGGRGRRGRGPLV